MHQSITLTDGINKQELANFVRPDIAAETSRTLLVGFQIAKKYGTTLYPNPFDYKLAFRNHQDTPNVQKVFTDLLYAIMKPDVLFYKNIKSPAKKIDLDIEKDFTGGDSLNRAIGIKHQVETLISRHMRTRKFGGVEFKPGKLSFTVDNPEITRFDIFLINGTLPTGVTSMTRNEDNTITITTNSNFKNPVIYRIY